MGKSRVKLLFSLMTYFKNLNIYMFFNCLIGLVFNLIPIGIGIVASFMLKGYFLGDLSLIKKMFITIIALSVAYSIFSYADLWFSHDIAYRILGTLREEIYYRLEKAIPVYGLNMTTAEMAAVAAQDVEYLEWFYAHTVNTGFIALVSSILLLIIFANIHISLALLALIFILLVISVPFLFNSKSKKDGDILRKTHADIDILLTEAIQGMKEIDSLQIYDKVEKMLDDKEEKYGKATKADKLRSISQSNIVDILIFSSGVCMLTLASQLVSNGIIEKHIFPLVVITMINIFSPIRLFMTMTSQFSTIFASAKRVSNLLNLPIQVENKGLEDAPNTIESIEFKDIYYRYPGSEKWILEGVSFKIKRGEFVGLAGLSGSGKSTIINLIQRFAEADKGEIMVNENNIRNYDLESWKDIVSTVRQDEYIFNTSFFDNIRMSKLNASRKEIEDVAKNCQAHNFISETDMAYDTVVGERATTISGGERQRLSTCKGTIKRIISYLIR